jgi:ATP synthase protein I
VRFEVGIVLGNIEQRLIDKAVEPPNQCPYNRARFASSTRVSGSNEADFTVFHVRALHMAQQPNYRQVGAVLAGPALGKLYATQIAILIVASLCSLWVDITTAYSVLLGGLIFIAPTGFFARQAFRFRGAQATLHIARAFYRGETTKFVLTAMAFALVFALVKPLNLIALWLAYVAAMIVHQILAARESSLH